MLSKAGGATFKAAGGKRNTKKRRVGGEKTEEGRLCDERGGAVDFPHLHTAVKKKEKKKLHTHTQKKKVMEEVAVLCDQPACRAQLADVISIKAFYSGKSDCAIWNFCVFGTEAGRRQRHLAGVATNLEEKEVRGPFMTSQRANRMEAPIMARNHWWCRG